MQSYEDLERKQAKEIMKQDWALACFRENLMVESEVISLEELMKQTIPEPLIDKSYQLHQEQRKDNKRVNMSFNMLTFAIKQQISMDKRGENNGTLD